MMHRIRFAMADDHSAPVPLTGTVEIDETYVGGKPRIKGKHNHFTRYQRKTPVVAMVQRGGDVRAQVVPRVNGKNLKRFIRENIHKSARLMTDEAPYYKRVGKEYEGGHFTVNHSEKEYVRGDVYTNTVEGFFSILKRGLLGTFHSVSKKHLHRYVAEFEFKYNSRKLDDGARTVLAIRKAQGKRLLYREPV